MTSSSADTAATVSADLAHAAHSHIHGLNHNPIPGHGHSANSLPQTSIQLVVGKIDAGVAILLTGDHHILEFPTLLLPPDIATGSIIDVSVSRNARAETEALLEFSQLQDAILAELGDAEPVAPVLSTAANTTETSVVLQWSGGLAVGGTQLESTLDIVVNNDVIASHQVAPGALSGECEVDGLEPGYEYTCQVVLRCGGTSLASEPLVVRTLGEREHAASSPRVERRASLTTTTTAAAAAGLTGAVEDATTAAQVESTSSRPASPPTGDTRTGAAFDDVDLSPRSGRPGAIDTDQSTTASSPHRAPSPLPPVTTAPPRSRSTSPTRRAIPEFTDPADEVIKKAVSNKNLASPAAAAAPILSPPPADEGELDTPAEPLDASTAETTQSKQQQAVEQAEQAPSAVTTDPLGQDIAATEPAPLPLLDLRGSPQAQASQPPAAPPLTGSTAADILMSGFDAGGLMDVSLDAPPPAAAQQVHDLLGLDLAAADPAAKVDETEEQVAAKEPLPASPDKRTQDDDEQAVEGDQK